VLTTIDLVVRGDGTLVKLEKAASPRQEASAFLALFKDWRMLALFPMFFCSNYCECMPRVSLTPVYSYQGAIVVHLFNGRTRALSSFCTALGAIVGALFIGVLVDKLPFRRRNRALISISVVFLLNMAVWGGGIAFQLRFDRSTPSFDWDWKNSAAAGPLVLLASCEWSI